MDTMTRGEAVCAFIEEYCRVPEGSLVGQPIKLEPFQRSFIIDIYDNPKAETDFAILSMARKNGKTALIAGIALAHLVGPEARQNSQIVSGAMSRDQAAIVFRLAEKMIYLNEDLDSICRVVPSTKTIIGLPMSTEYKALAAEGKTAHGLSPVLALLDEVGQVEGPQSAFIDAIITAQGAHDNALVIVLSTQAASDADLLSVWIDDAKENKDPGTVLHLYETSPDADLLDEESWKASNPALRTFRSYKDLKKLVNKAYRMPSMENQIRNLNLNQRVSTANPFVSVGVWKLNSRAPGSLKGLDVYAGLDLSARTDLTALVLVAQDAKGNVKVKPYFWTPSATLKERAKRDRVPYEMWVKQGYLRTTPGATVDYEYVCKDIEDICEVEGIVIESMAFDRWRIDVLDKELERQTLVWPLVEHGQGYKDMSPALDELESLLLNGRLEHGMHPVLTAHAAKAVVSSDPANNRKLDKHKANGRIDGMVALAMAVRMLTRAEGGDFDEAVKNTVII